LKFIVECNTIDHPENKNYLTYAADKSLEKIGCNSIDLNAEIPKIIFGNYLPHGTLQNIFRSNADAIRILKNESPAIKKAIMFAYSEIGITIHQQSHADRDKERFLIGVLLGFISEYGTVNSLDNKQCLADIANSAFDGIILRKMAESNTPDDMRVPQHMKEVLEIINKYKFKR